MAAAVAVAVALVVAVVAVAVAVAAAAMAVAGGVGHCNWCVGSTPVVLLVCQSSVIESHC